MNFDFDRASREAQHIIRFMDMAQECLAQMNPIPEEKRDCFESIFSLVQVSGRIAQGLVEQLDNYV